MKIYEGRLSKLINNILFSVSILFLIIACGSEPQGQSTGNGAIAFSIDWQNSPPLVPETASKALSVSQAPLDCVATGVATVEAVVYDSSNAVVALGGPWSCDAHSGSIANVPAGTNWRVAVIGKDGTGTILYYGEAGGVSVTGGQTTNLGAITASLFIPTGLTTTTGNGQINLNWNGWTGASSYNIYWSTTPGVTKATGTKIVNAVKPYVHTGLVNWTPYYYVVAAVNSQGEGKESAQVSASPTDAVPPAPTGVTAVAGDGQATLSWNAVNGATYYNIYYSLTSGVTKTAGTKIPSVTTPFVHNGRTNWTTYYYVVTAVDSQGESIDSAQVSALPPGTPPAAPTSISVTPGSGQNSISWTAATGATSYNIYWSTTTGVTIANGTQISNVTSPYSHTGLNNGTAYYYVVTTVGVFGESIESTEVGVAANTSTTLASGLTYPYDMTADSANLYWIENYSGIAASVEKVGKDGTGRATLATGSQYYGGIAVDATSVYWADSGGIVMKVGINGGSATAIASGLNYPMGIAVDATSVYWTDNNGTNGTVKKVGINGGTVTTLATGLYAPSAITLDSTSVYWTNGDGTIKKVGLNGGTITTLASGQGQAYGIAVDSTDVYWAGGGTSYGYVKKAGINGGTVTTLASGLNSPMKIAIDSTSVYCTENGFGVNTGSVRKIGINGKTVTTLASGLQSPYGIATDSTNVYWSESQGGTAKKVQK